MECHALKEQAQGCRGTGEALGPYGRLLVLVSRETSVLRCEFTTSCWRLRTSLICNELLLFGVGTGSRCAPNIRSVDGAVHDRSSSQQSSSTKEPENRCKRHEHRGRNEGGFHVKQGRFWAFACSASCRYDDVVHGVEALRQV